MNKILKASKRNIELTLKNENKSWQKLEIFSENLENKYVSWKRYSQSKMEILGCDKY